MKHVMSKKLKDKKGRVIKNGDTLVYNNGRTVVVDFPKDFIWLKARTELAKEYYHMAVTNLNK